MGAHREEGYRVKTPIRFLIAAVAVALGMTAFLLGGARTAVDWRRLRAVVVESDDWGLAGFVPNADAWQGLDREALTPGRFPDVYWGSTLEDSADVAELADLLDRVRGRDGLPAVLQPNYVMFSLAWDGTTWVRRGLPALPVPYARPGLWQAVADARRRGVWHPEFHATWHYDPAHRRERALEPGVAVDATRRGIMLFPGSERARELGPWRSDADLAGELALSLERFEDVFGRPVGAVVAPDYTWNSRVEDLWERQGLTVIQGKREQRNPDLPRGLLGRIAKFATRRWDVLAHGGRTYLERNCRYEPAQSRDPAAVADACRAQVFTAWAKGEPAIIETHRVNFAHTDRDLARAGREGLGGLLADLAEAGPVFLADSEVAQLARRGVSCTFRGDGMILRNGTFSRRVVTVPAVEGRPMLVALAPGVVLRVGIDSRGRIVVVPAPD